MSSTDRSGVGFVRSTGLVPGQLPNLVNSCRPLSKLVAVFEQLFCRGGRKPRMGSHVRDWDGRHVANASIVLGLLTNMRVATVGDPTRQGLAEASGSSPRRFGPFEILFERRQPFVAGCPQLFSDLADNCRGRPFLSTRQATPPPSVRKESRTNEHNDLPSNEWGRADNRMAPCPDTCG